MRKPALLAAVTMAAALAGSLAAAAPSEPFRLSEARLTADGGAVHGAVCRAGPQRIAASPLVTVQTGQGSAAARVTPYGDVRARGPGCFYYTAPVSGPGAVTVCVSRRIDGDARRQCVTAAR